MEFYLQFVSKDFIASYILATCCQIKLYDVRCCILDGRVFGEAIIKYYWKRGGRMIHIGDLQQKLDQQMQLFIILAA